MASSITRSASSKADVLPSRRLAAHPPSYTDSSSSSITLATGTAPTSGPSSSPSNPQNILITEPNPKKRQRPYGGSDDENNNDNDDDNSADGDGVRNGNSPYAKDKRPRLAVDTTCLIQQTKQHQQQQSTAGEQVVRNTTITDAVAIVPVLPTSFSRVTATTNSSSSNPKPKTLRKYSRHPAATTTAGGKTPTKSISSHRDNNTTLNNNISNSANVTPKAISTLTPQQVHSGGGGGPDVNPDPSPGLPHPEPDGSKEKSKAEGRKLRSQEVTKFKSDLSCYFFDYDEVIGNETREQQLLNYDTQIAMIDSAYPAPQIAFPVRTFASSAFNDLFNTQRIDFKFLDSQKLGQDTHQDTLPDSHFEPSHKRAERLEKSIRNSEKGRAQHEKNQVVRLLNGLQSHEWLKVMGVAGVTESRKKSFEPARDYFIKGCQAILDKFQAWTVEEKRRKLRKGRGHLGLFGEEDDGDTSNVDSVGRREDDDAAAADSDADVSISAKQICDDTEGVSSRSRQHAGKDGGHRRRSVKQQQQQDHQQSRPPEPEKEFVSFFKKRHERDMALNTRRRVGRKVVAWGCQIPEIPEVEFALPDDFIDEEALRTHARRKRRDLRSKP